MATTTKPDLSISTTEHPNVGAMREAFAAFSRGDLDAVRASLAPDCVWTNAGSSAIAGTFRGWEQISAMFGKLFELTGGTFAMQIRSILADDSHAVALYDSTSTVGGQTATQRFVLVDEVDGNGKVTAAQALAYDQAASDQHLMGATKG